MSGIDLTTAVQFRDIPDATGYRVGDDGNAWSRYKRGRPGGLTSTWLPLTSVKDSLGYLSVRLKFNDGKMRTVRLHQLVMLAFVGPPPEGHEVLHADGTRDNNRLENLSYGTRSENMKDAVRHGSHVRPANSGRRELSPETVRRIRHLRSQGYTQEKIGQMCGTSQTNVSAIVRGRAWSHLE